MITEATKAEAARLVKAVEASLARARPDLTAEWLARLGMLCAPRNEATDAVRAKLAAYVDMLDHPAWVFTARTLKEAAAKFTWFPAFAEVNAFLDEHCASERQFLAALQKAAQAEVVKLVDEKVTFEQLEAIKARNPAAFASSTKRKRLSLGWKGDMSPAERARVRREIDAKEQARREREGVV